MIALEFTFEISLLQFVTRWQVISIDNQNEGWEWGTRPPGLSDYSSYLCGSGVQFMASNEARNRIFLVQVFTPFVDTLLLYCSMKSDNEYQQVKLLSRP
jgi:hypothetical protein